MLFRLTMAAALALASAPLHAQAFLPPIGISDADALAEQVRRLGSNPRDLDALLTAAELSLRLDDLSAAGSFLARADRIAPSTVRSQAVKASILVRSERPGEALRLFTQAEAMGMPAVRMAADRGLAYDLIGDQRRAQRDYRLVMDAGAADDEVRRRYALSLGISGNTREALDQLAPLVRRNDRAAWRSRAFILAMSGDAAQASQIASTMMPPGSAQGLQGFFAELPRLPAIDRAFAVHFGQVRPTMQRLADARLAPQLAPLAPEPVQVAIVAPPPTTARERNRRRREKAKSDRAAIAATPAPSVIAVVEPTLQPPAYVAPAYRPSAPPTYTAADRPLTPGEQASLAAATLRPAARRANRPALRPTVNPTPTPTLVERPRLAVTAQPTPPVQRPVVLATALPRTTIPTPNVVTRAPAPAAPTPSTVVAVAPTAATAPVALAPVTPASNEVSVATASPAPGRVTAISPSVTTALPPARLAVTRPVPRPARVSRTQADSILARIVANLSIPASELGIDKPAPGAKPARTVDKKDFAKDRKLAVEKLPAEKKADARKLLADKKAAAEKKLLADKAAAEKKAARGEPARIWVQVAGGANERDLAKAWSSARAKAPAAFAGRQGYSTPLRATNRVLTGPFKTDAEARAYVNQLAKSGVSAFSFTSDAGQKVSRLGTK